MNQDILLALIIFGGTFLLLLIILIVMKNRKKRKYRKWLDELEYKKNEISSVPVSPELAKAEEYLNGERLENMYKGWQERLDNIKEEKIPLITDMLIDAEDALQNKDYKSTMYKIAKLEMELYKVKTKSDFLLDEIKNITNGEERNRAIITKLKAKYRELLEKFNATKLEFEDMAKPVEMQFDNIASLFEDFEKTIEENNFDEINSIIKAVRDMLKHLEVVVDEMPSVVLIAENILPKKMEEITQIYEKMKNEGYPLDYLNIEFNIEEANKKITDILDRARVLNLENSLFELKILTEYFESLFTDFEKEKLIKSDYSAADKTLKSKLNKMNSLVTEIFSEMEGLKSAYKLDQADITALEEVKKELDVLNNDYKSLSGHENTHNFAYSRLTDEVENLALRLSKIEDKLDKSLNVIGSMHDDEMRARQQLDEVNNLLKDAKAQIRNYNLPVIPNSYYVELKEASEAIKEIVKELDKKPVTIEILNTRVDTARDLVLKLFGKTKEMMKTAMFAEMAIVYGNRYRSHEKELDKNLIYSEALFNKGEYQKSLELTINSLNRIEPGIYEKLLDLYGEKVK
ncbi:MAG: septation ring formation regulator EzrA [Bacilli bacterium]|nr:septation ring formation regulator EzrA [Bacilli bacterium]